MSVFFYPVGFCYQILNVSLSHRHLYLLHYHTGPQMCFKSSYETRKIKELGKISNLCKSSKIYIFTLWHREMLNHFFICIVNNGKNPHKNCVYHFDLFSLLSQAILFSNIFNWPWIKKYWFFQIWFMQVLTFSFVFQHLWEK